MVSHSLTNQVEIAVSSFFPWPNTLQSYCFGLFFFFSNMPNAVQNDALPHESPFFP